MVEEDNRGPMEELQLLVQSLTRKVGEAEERYSLLQEQTDRLRELLTSNQEQYSQKESMYQQNVGFHSSNPVGPVLRSVFDWKMACDLCRSRRSTT